MTAQRILADLLAVLGGIPEDGQNYRNLREALTLTEALVAALDVKA